MKKFFIILFVIICLLGFSVVPLAATVYKPEQHSFLHEENGRYILDVDIKTSQFTDEQLSFWNSFINAFMGNSTDIPFIIYNKSGNQLTFGSVKPNTYFFYFASSSSSYQLHPNSGNSFSAMNIDISNGVAGDITQYNFSKTLVITRSSNNTYVFWGYEKLLSNDSKNGNNKDRINYVNWDGMRLQIKDDLGSFNVQHNLTIHYQYSNGTQAFETYSNTFSEGDSFSIPSPTLGGFKPSLNTISGQMGNTDLSYTVTYTPVNHSVTVNYQYENGSKALEPFSGTFSEGQPYSIPTPVINGYTPSLNIISGEMGTSDLSYTVIFTKVKEPDPPPSSSGNSSSSGNNSSSSGNSSSSSSNGGYVVWNPSFMANGFQNVSNMIGLAFNTFIWLFLGIMGLLIIIKLVRHLFK